MLYLKNSLAVFDTFEETTTSRSTILKDESSRYTNHATTDFKMLQLIKEYKKQVKSNFEKYYNKYEYQKISYYGINQKNLDASINKTIYVCDLRKAYLMVIYNSNLINLQLFNKIKEYYLIEKPKVMQIIGSIAVRKTIKTYKDKILIKKEIDENIHGRLIWNFIENKINDEILKAKNENNKTFIYYWCDEIAFLEIPNINYSKYKATKSIINSKGEIVHQDTGEIKYFSDILKFNQKNY